MRIGLALPHYDFSFPDGEPLSWSRLADAARRAEALGFDSVWISDHFFLDLERYGGSPEPSGTVEPFTALAALATATERVRLGTLVLGGTNGSSRRSGTSTRARGTGSASSRNRSR